MSTQPPTSSHDPGPHGQQSEDAVDYTKVILVGVVSLIVFALCTWWAAVILRRETDRLVEKQGAPRTPSVAQQEIGIVDQVPFAADHRLGAWKAAHDARLNGYGWVDKAKGIAHIPIEEAMKKVAAGAAPPGAPK